MSLEAQQEHAVRMGKWAQAAMRQLRSHTFLAVVMMSSKLKGPLDHLLFFLQQARPAGEPSNLAILIWGKAAEIREDLRLLTRVESWDE
eukprot:1456873-Alexandrium_andersonii.AAC.1